MAKQLTKIEGTCYSLEEGCGMGGDLCPPGHAAHRYAIVARGDYSSLEYVVTHRSFYPKEVVALADKLLDEHPGVFTEEWASEVRQYLGNGPDADAHILDYFPNYTPTAAKEA